MAVTPNVVKYSTSSIANATLVGSVAFGWVGNDYGPSETSGWYAGVNVPSGSYAVYATSASQIVSVTVANSDNELINIGNQLTGQNFISASQAQTYLNSNGFAVATQVYTSSADLIRAALTSAYTASYDSATVGSFIQVDSSSYNNVVSNLSATKYGMADATINGADGLGTSWGSGFSFTFTQSAALIPANNYMVGYSVVASWGPSTQSVIAYFSTSSAAAYTGSAAVYYKLGGTTSAISPTLNTRLYFICKAPTFTLPGTSAPAVWANGSLRIKGVNVSPIPYFIGTPTASAQFSGSWNPWISANTGQPGHQFIATTNKQW